MGDCFQYRTWNNGSHPYMVNVYHDRYVVFDYYQYQDEIEDCVDEFCPIQKVILNDDNFSKIFIGDNYTNDPDYGQKGESQFAGNSILVESNSINDKIQYIFIGYCVKAFNIPKSDRIQIYSSPLGIGGISYPYAVGKKNTYFLLDDIYIPNKYLDLNKDGYSQFYELPDEVKVPFGTGLIHSHND
jgi:hypothetical protein